LHLVGLLYIINAAISAKFGTAIFINKVECGLAIKSKSTRRDALTVRWRMADDQ